MKNLGQRKAEELVQVHGDSRGAARIWFQFLDSLPPHVLQNSLCSKQHVPRPGANNRAHPGTANWRWRGCSQQSECCSRSSCESMVSSLIDSWAHRPHPQRPELDANCSLPPCPSPPKTSPDESGERRLPNPPGRTPHLESPLTTNRPSLTTLTPHWSVIHNAFAQLTYALYGIFLLYALKSLLADLLRAGQKSELVQQIN